MVQKRILCWFFVLLVPLSCRLSGDLPPVVSPVAENDSMATIHVKRDVDEQASEDIEHDKPSISSAPKDVVSPADTPLSPTETDLPAGYVPFDDVKRQKYTRILRKSRRIYLRSRKDGCDSMRIEKGRLTRTDVEVDDDGNWTRRSTHEFGFEAGGGGVWLTGPGGESITYDRTGTVVGKSGWGTGTSTYLAVVGGNRHEIHLVAIEPPGRIRGYPPDRIETWFLDRASCEAH